MRIELKKFGTLLLSRPSGREALAAFQPRLKEIPPGENIEVDFNGVTTFSPSWGDEFLTQLALQFSDRVKLLPSDNLSVKATLDILEQTSGKKFLRV